MMNSDLETNHQNNNMKPHAVCLPFPCQGHINPMFKLAILLHSKGFHITFVNTEYNHRRLLKSRGHNSLDGFPGFNFETIPDGLPSSTTHEDTADATQDIPSLCQSTSNHCLVPFRALLLKLNAVKASNSGPPPVSCVVCDSLMSFAVAAAKEIGMPVACFRTTNAVSFLGNKYLPVLIQKEIIPLKDSTCITNGYLDTKLDCLPSMKNVRLRDLPTYARTDLNDPTLNFIMEQAIGASKASALIIHTLDELECEVLATLSSMCPPIYAIGPLHSLVNQLPKNSLKFVGANLWKEDLECLEWLNSKAPNSVVYVNFGSITVLTLQQVVEFAWGLADSKKNFLWIIRSDAVVGDCDVTLPSEFVEETKERGLIVRWCPQEQVLNHPSVGVFLTHCGWNSMIESLASGVPMICWPFFADQHINCRFACTEWDVGLEIDSNVNRVEVAKLVNEVIEGEKGKEMKNKAIEWKNKAEEATTAVNGSSYLNLDKLVTEILLNKHY